MLPQNKPDRIRKIGSFNDHRLVANAGLLLPATLAQAPGQCRGHPSPAPCGNSSTITLTSAERRDGRTLGTRC